MKVSSKRLKSNGVFLIKYEFDYKSFFAVFFLHLKKHRKINNNQV